jgi:hypothetical protein
MTLQEWLEQSYGKENALVKNWKWTPQQLEQLKAMEEAKKTKKKQNKG